MKKILILLIAFICLSACSATEKHDAKKNHHATALSNDSKSDKDSKSDSDSKQQKSDNENNNLNKQKENNDFDSEFAITKVKNHLNISDSKAFTFDIMKQSSESITVKVISKNLQSNGGSGAVGIYIVNKAGNVKEDIIPGIFKGTWKSKDNTVSYIISDHTVQSGEYVYDITDVKITGDNNDYTTYELSWDLDKFKLVYPENINPQPIIFRYHKSNDTIETSVLLYRQ